jgi:hypothetical protein
MAYSPPGAREKEIEDRGLFQKQVQKAVQINEHVSEKCFVDTCDNTGTEPMLYLYNNKCYVKYLCKEHSKLPMMFPLIG